MGDLFKTFPKHDKKRTNPAVDYSRVILEEKLSILTPNYADVLIDYINDKNEEAIKQMIFGLIFNE